MTQFDEATSLEELEKKLRILKHSSVKSANYWTEICKCDKRLIDRGKTREEAVALREYFEGEAHAYTEALRWL